VSAYGPAELQRDLNVSRETIGRLSVFRGLLETWSGPINLVGPNELRDYWRRHALDSAQLLNLGPPDAKRWLDLGSGAGFPGLVVACCLEQAEAARVDLVERSTKKAAFLREAIRTLAAPAQVLNLSLEGLNPEQGDYQVVTARALAPLNRLILYARPWLNRGAVGLFPKGADYASELIAAGFSPKGGEFSGLGVDVVESMSDPRARVIRIRRVN
jgi:16S rRNA (guanine527-N7)-methyltransferase